MLASAGRDPRPSLEAARKRDPHGDVIPFAAARLRSRDPKALAAAAPNAPLILPPDNLLPDAAID